MKAEVENNAVHASGTNPSWEVILTVWEDERCVLSASLNDDHHGRRWHHDYAKELARRINRGD